MGWACLVTLVTLGAFTVISAHPDTIHSEDSPTLTPQVYLPYVARSCPGLPEPMPIGLWEVSRNPTRGFYWPYFLYLPENLQGKQALVIPNNTGERNDDFCVHRTRAFETMIWRIPWADSLGVPLIVPVFPRFDDETDGTIASQYLVMVGGVVACPSATTKPDAIVSPHTASHTPFLLALPMATVAPGRGLASVAVMSPLAAHLCMLLSVEGRSRIWKLRISFVKLHRCHQKHRSKS